VALSVTIFIIILISPGDIKPGNFSIHQALLTVYTQVYTCPFKIAGLSFELALILIFKSLIMKTLMEKEYAMQYRKVGKTGEMASALGFGIMRLPGWLENRIDEEKSMEMIAFAIENGLTYMDTAYPYINGLSEPFVAKILNAGYREKVTVATKLPQWEVKEYADFDRYLNQQLERLQMEQIDFYLIHAIDGKSWPRLKALGILDWLAKIAGDGRVKHIGFSFHDDFEPFEQIVNDYDW
jgi:predicted aldo/keto reductase-like oxidoreductase